MVAVVPITETIPLEGRNLTLVVVVLAIALLALVMGTMFRRQVLAADTGTDKMREIGAAVEEGAQAYLARQFKTLAVFVVLVFGLLFLLPADTSASSSAARCSSSSGPSSLPPSATSACGWPSRPTCASRRRLAPASREDGMRIAFRTGGTVGMATVGLGLLGASTVVLIYQGDAPKVLEGFGFGAALLAMFMRVGGGIFTKAADVGADLVGKVEAGIPEDDPRNAATIADNVGDNVGDCAGMAADLFESYAVTLVAALILGSVALRSEGLVFPLLVPAIGAVTAMIGVFITRVRANENGLAAINRGFYISAVISAVLSTAAAFIYLPQAIEGTTGLRIRALARRHLRDRARRCHPLAHRSLHRHDLPPHPRRGPHVADRPGHRHSRGYRCRSRVGGLHRRHHRCGRLRCIPARWRLARPGAVLHRAGRLWPAHHGRRHRGHGHLRAGLRQRPGHRRDVPRRRRGGRSDPHRPRRRRQHHQGHHQGHRDRHGGPCCDRTVRLLQGRCGTALLDAGRISQGELVDLSQRFLVNYPSALVGMLLGASVVFLFSGLAINAVTRAAGAIIFEVRRQIRDIPGIMEGTAKPEYGKVVDICTRDSLRELATPGLLAALTPIAVGFALGVGALAGFLAGAISTGCLMAVFLANSGGSWDNAKKIVEDGTHGGKGSDAHSATVIGDTVGDPFKDTAGPAINPLIKVMNLVSLLIAPAIVSVSIGSGANPTVPYGIAAVALLVIVVAVAITKRRDLAITGGDIPAQSTPVDA